MGISTLILLIIYLWGDGGSGVLSQRVGRGFEKYMVTDKQIPIVYKDLKLQTDVENCWF